MGFRWLSRQRYLRAIGALSLILPLSLFVSVLGCGDRSVPKNTIVSPAVGTAGIRAQPIGPTIPNGDYPIQQAQYDDASGEYALTLLNPPAGVRPVYTTQRLRMAQVSAADRRAGKASFLRLNGAVATLYLTPNFAMNYVHNVTQTQVNPQTGQQETVVVGQETTAWQPMANRGDRATEVVNVYQPYYYLPPRYNSGGLYGYGGYGPTYDVAAQQYQTRYNEPPPASRTTSFRSSGNLRSTPATTTSPATSPTADAPGSIARPTAGSSPSANTPGPDLRKPGSTTPGSMSSPAANPDGAANPSQTNQPTTPTKPTTSTPTHTGSRSTGAGYGSSTLHNGGSSGSASPRRSSSSASSSTGRSSFGSGSGRSRSSSGGSRRR